SLFTLRRPPPSTLFPYTTLFRSSPKEATRQPNLLSAVPNTCARSCEVLAPVGLVCSGLCSVVFRLTSRPDTLNFTACGDRSQREIWTNHPVGVDQRLRPAGLVQRCGCMVWSRSPLPADFKLRRSLYYWERTKEGAKRPTE